MSAIEKDIVDLITGRGPSTGAEIRDALGGDSLELWRACRSSSSLSMKTLGRRYLRLDRQVDGYARLSPSILREFLTYSVTALAGDLESLDRRVIEIESRIRDISRAKLSLARSFVATVTSQIEASWPEHPVCFILAGDIVFDMAHDVPRPERSTGKLVNGSDIDLVVVADDRVPEAFLKSLDDAIYREKYRTLITPSIKEEIDYIVKRMARVREQLAFDTFKRMVACKILVEGVLLSGSEPAFRAIKAMLTDGGIVARLEALEASARALRSQAEDYLLHGVTGRIDRKDLVLFYSVEESEEFE